VDKLSVAALTFALGCLVTADPALAQSASLPAPQAAASELSAQRRPVRRVRPRITVYPRLPYDGTIGRSGNRFDVFPRPYTHEWPGPDAYRSCVGWLEGEYRLTGLVVVPRRRCRWIPG
jgi:hypothetical protein